MISLTFVLATGVRLIMTSLASAAAPAAAKSYDSILTEGAIYFTIFGEACLILCWVSELQLRLTGLATNPALADLETRFNSRFDRPNLFPYNKMHL